LQKVMKNVTFRDPEGWFMTISDFIIQLTAKGAYCFTFHQVKEALGVSDVAARAALRRLKQKGEVAQPLSGFYVIVSPEYKVLGCRPADHFIHDLMQYVGLPYYIGLLSAAQFYGIAHHRPQQFQVITKQKRRAIICGRVKIVFITRKDYEKVPTLSFGTAYGPAIVSSPEATVMDMITYPYHCGGLDNVLTVLNDWLKKLDANKLLQLASNTDEVTWIQRLGYLFDLIKAEHLTEALFKSLKDHRVRFRLLAASQKKSPVLEKLAAKLEKDKKQSSHKIKNNKWKLIINKKLEVE
jgi:predicted transcriptional regulator of viral defense system